MLFCFIVLCNPKEVVSNTSGGINLPGRTRANKGRDSVFHVLYLGCHHMVWSRYRADLLVFVPQNFWFKMGIHTSNDLIKKTPRGYVQPLGFSWLQLESSWQPRLATIPLLLLLTPIMLGLANPVQTFTYQFHSPGLITAFCFLKLNKFCSICGCS